MRLWKMYEPKITEYALECKGITCTGVDWNIQRFYFSTDGIDYVFDQTEDVEAYADTDHIRLVIEYQFLPWLKEKKAREEATKEAYMRGYEWLRDNLYYDEEGIAQRFYERFLEE